MPQTWHGHGMARVRVSTTVDEEILSEARLLRGVPDSVLLDEALRALLSAHRSAEVDAAYVAAYDAHPIDEPDEWGDLASWRAAAADS
jgi:hypothetical protein